MTTLQRHIDITRRLDVLYRDSNRTAKDECLSWDHRRVVCKQLKRHIKVLQFALNHS